MCYVLYVSYISQYAEPFSGGGGNAIQRITVVTDVSQYRALQ